MDVDRLFRYQRRLRRRTPIVGGWLRRRTAQALARLGSREALQALAEILEGCADPRLRYCAVEALSRVEAAEIIDTLCALWAKSRQPDLTALVAERGWVATGPPALKVLTALKAGRPEAVAAGGAEVVEPLAAACEDRDQDVCSGARHLLGRLQHPEAQKALCRLAIERDDEHLRGAVLAAGYTPAEPHLQTLFYFLTEQWEKYEAVDFDHTRLRAAYEASGERMRSRIADKARLAGRLEWLGLVTPGGLRQKRRLGEMSDLEWETTLAILRENSRWDEMWRLAQEAPPRWSAGLLRSMPAEWRPDSADDLAGYEELRQLALRCRDEVALDLQIRCRVIFREHLGLIHYLAMGRAVAAPGERRDAAQLWLAVKPELREMLARLWSRVTCLTMGNRGVWLLARSAGALHREVEVWGLADWGQALICNCGGGQPRDEVTSLAFSPDKQTLVSGSADQRLHFWSMPEGYPIGAAAGHTQAVSCLAFSPDGKLLLSGSLDNTLRVWDQGGAALQVLSGHDSSVTCLAVTPDGRFAVSGSSDKTLRLWDPLQGRAVASLNGHTRALRTLAVSPDSRILASGSEGSAIRLWAVPEGIQLKALSGHEQPVLGLAFHPESGELAVACEDGTIRLWELALVRPSSLPPGRANAQDLAEVQVAQRQADRMESERNWLAFIEALLRWHQRYDIEIADAPVTIAAGEFDIEIAG